MDPYSSDLSGTNPPSSDPGEYDNPYGLNAAKNPKDAGMGGHADGGMKFENSMPESGTSNTY